MARSFTALDRVQRPDLDSQALVDGEPQVIAQGHLGAGRKKLRMLPALTPRRQAREPYGQVIGVTKALASIEWPQIREKRDDGSKATRTYVPQTVRMRDKKRPAMIASVEKPLIFVIRWEPPQAAATRSDDANAESTAEATTTSAARPAAGSITRDG